MERPLRVVVYDRTCTGPRWLPGLSHAWSVGSHLYRARGDVDHVVGVRSWTEAFDRIAALAPAQAVGEVQYWGHGRFGEVLVDGERWDRGALTRTHPLHAGIEALRKRLTPDALVWFRTCSAFGTDRGQAFAEALADHLRCQVAAHTYIIGFWQSGLRALRPGERARWDPREGVEPGSAATPAWSAASAPSTITCFEGRSSLRRLVD